MSGSRCPLSREAVAAGTATSVTALTAVPLSALSVALRCSCTRG